MSRPAGSHGRPAASVAAELGCSADTVRRTEERALEKMRAAWGARPRRDPSPLERCRHLLAYRDYCACLMACRPGEEPDGVPPCG